LPNLLVGTINFSAPASTLVASSYDTAVAANLDRLGLVLTNLSNSTIYIAFGANAAVLNRGIVLTPNGGVWTMDEYNFTNERITAIANTANSILAIQEFVR